MKLRFFTALSCRRDNDDTLAYVGGGWEPATSFGGGGVPTVFVQEVADADWNLFSARERAHVVSSIPFGNEQVPVSRGGLLTLMYSRLSLDTFRKAPGC